jgi:hypothetical protein
MNPEQILLIGHPRCGATYLAAAFKAYDYDIRRGEPGIHGIVSWALAVDPKQNGQQIIHYVRNPLYSLPSIVYADRKDSQNYNYRKRILYTLYHINLDDYSPLDRAAISFILWNKMIDEQKPGFVVRIEDSIVPLLQYLGWKVGHHATNESYNNKATDAVDWSTLRPDLLKTLDKWCFENGYQELCKSINEPIVVHRQAPVLPRSQRSTQLVLGPRTRNNKPHTPTPLINGDYSNVRPRLVHNVTVQTQAHADVTTRERQRRTGFSVRGK